MKKIFILIYLTLTIIFLLGLNNKEEIANKLETEIISTLNNLQSNFIQDVNITYSFEVQESKSYLAYVFTFRVKDESKTLKIFKKVYNFEKEASKKVYLNKELLESVYLDLLNENLSKFNLTLTVYDLHLIEYIIQDEVITFIIPREVTFNIDLKIKINNLGISFENDSNKSSKFVALTFDDGPSSQTKEIVDLLNKYKIKATFFVLGERVKIYSDEILFIYQHGHEIGNHSYSHPNFKYLNTTDTIYEIEKTQEVIYDITQHYPKLFRFPYGSYNNQNLKYINLPLIFWNVDSLDWYYKENDLIINNILKDLKDKNVILFHDVNNYKKDALIWIVEYLIKEGYEFKTVSELYDLRLENYISGKKYY